jgi:hypothetical protein
MFNSRNFKISLIAGLVATATIASAQVPPIETTASLTLNSAFTVTPGDSLDFGVIRASAVYTGSETDGIGAGVRILTNGSAPEELPGTAPGTPTDWAQTATVITAGTPATFDISGAVPNVDLQIVSEVTDVELEAAGNAADELFNLVIEYEDMRVTGGPSSGSIYNGTTTMLTTDGTGATQLTVGGKLRIDGEAPDIPVGEYTGDYTITISY